MLISYRGNIVINVCMFNLFSCFSFLLISMATESLIPQQSYNPSCPVAVEEVAIDMSMTRNDMLLIMEDFRDSVKDDKKADTAMTRLAGKIVDSLLWKIFKIMCFLFLAASIVVGCYCVYYFLIREDVDSVFTKINNFFTGLLAVLTKIVQLIEKIHDMLISFGENAKVVVEEMQTHVLNSEDKIDALFMAMN